MDALDAMIGVFVPFLFAFVIGQLTRKGTVVFVSLGGMYSVLMIGIGMLIQARF